MIDFGIIAEHNRKRKLGYITESTLATPEDLANFNDDEYVAWIEKRSSFHKPIPDPVAIEVSNICTRLLKILTPFIVKITWVECGIERVEANDLTLLLYTNEHDDIYDAHVKLVLEVSKTLGHEHIVIRIDDEGLSVQKHVYNIMLAGLEAIAGGAT